MKYAKIRFVNGKDKFLTGVQDCSTVKINNKILQKILNWKKLIKKNQNLCPQDLTKLGKESN